MIDVQMTDEVDEAGAEELRNAVIAFNIAVTGYSEGSALVCLLRDGAGKLIAGLDGFTWGGYAPETHHDAADLPTPARPAERVNLPAVRGTVGAMRPREAMGRRRASCRQFERFLSARTDDIRHGESRRHHHRRHNEANTAAPREVHAEHAAVLDSIGIAPG
jgi:hypothetical protein